MNLVFQCQLTESEAAAFEANRAFHLHLVTLMSVQLEQLNRTCDKKVDGQIVVLSEAGIPRVIDTF